MLQRSIASFWDSTHSSIRPHFQPKKKAESASCGDARSLNAGR
jgi:hypothetical protein